ncbi:hypothetical protein [Hymenobacter siberiensis]|uniref:hypothetical protein n=1 Tax=Hymenobacter siberiensis TaxID=2848396 RepID=UPI001C1E5AAF|nr:hypothetical protein [Hymenobacter siberiensis]MBU6122591.1 hypothetical protein [Hymenobacter siberiensis]
MSLVTGVFSIECSNCGTKRDFTPSDVDFEVASSTEEPMGTQTGYQWEETIECEECEKEIGIEYSVYEYPEGAFDMDEVKIKGGKELSRFGYEFHDAPERDEDDSDESDFDSEDFDEEDFKTK